MCIRDRHISINTYNFKKDNGKWKYFESEFTAEEDYDYIVIGSFGKLMDKSPFPPNVTYAVSYTHLRAHETVLDLVCRLLLEKKKKKTSNKKKKKK